jgi:hypothetical protein
MQWMILMIHFVQDHVHFLQQWARTLVHSNDQMEVIRHILVAVMALHCMTMRLLMVMKMMVLVDMMVMVVIVDMMALLLVAVVVQRLIVVVIVDYVDCERVVQIVVTFHRVYHDNLTPLIAFVRHPMRMTFLLSVL